MTRPADTIAIMNRVSSSLTAADAGFRVAQKAEQPAKIRKELREVRNRLEYIIRDLNKILDEQPEPEDSNTTHIDGGPLAPGLR